jgi:hypothetical protein
LERLENCQYIEGNQAHIVSIERLKAHLGACKICWQVVDSIQEKKEMQEKWNFFQGGFPVLFPKVGE